MTNRSCPECWAIRQELIEAGKAALEQNRRALDEWLSNGRSLREFYAEWLSLAEEPIGEPGSAFDAARRRRAEHEVLTGHSVALVLFPPAQ